MEEQIKVDSNEASICFESGDDRDLASLTLVERYDRFLLNENSDVDSDGDFFPDDTVLKEEYAQLRNGTANYTTQAGQKNHRLSTGLPGMFRNSDANLSVVDEDPRNGSAMEEQPDSSENSRQSGLIGLNELIEKLKLVRRCDNEEDNSIFCTAAELDAIQARYSDILNYVHELSSTFERTNSYKDLTAQQQDEQDEEQIRNTTESHEAIEQSEDHRLLAEKIELVQRARDRFFEVEQQVREQLDQLELVERYKMESVG